ncbi:MAG: DotI/IcmL/TraM family protein [Alphaproteobacteria bacterium]|nr:DotI/IcmL/TraM family protein [Alphaproteobacteria bacterium]MCB9975922.1 DotI/IcmL/TraM family protein [Rhodospirillales bacterium]
MPLRSLLLLLVLILTGAPSYAQVPPEFEMPEIPDIPGITTPKKKKKEIEPGVSQTFVKGLISAAANEVFTFSAHNYPERKKANKNYFTNTGYKSFYGAIEEGFLQNIRENKQNIKGYVISPVSVMQPKLVGEVVYWDASFNYVIEYISDHGTSYQFLNVLVSIKDVSEPYDPKVVINRWQSTIDKDPLFCPCRTDGGPKKGETLGDKLKRQFEMPESEELESEEDKLQKKKQEQLDKYYDMIKKTNPNYNPPQ